MKRYSPDTIGIHLTQALVKHQYLIGIRKPISLYQDISHQACAPARAPSAI